MCAINGIYHYSQDNDPTGLVLKMNKVSAHRGPDHSAIYKDDEVLLGHNRLSIIDLDKNAHQPFISNDKKVVLVFNGEIYNFQQLKAQIKDYLFKTNSDTEVLLAAYLKWGIDFVEKLNGMFSFAIWDKRNRKFILGRDRLGIKPLYYTEHNGAIVFASELRSIMSCHFIDKKIDRNSLFDYINYATVHGPDTIIDGVKTLPPAHLMVVNDDESKIFSYWDVRNKNKNIEYNDSQSFVHGHIKELFKDAVQNRLISDVPIGAFLSGGIDSSLVVAAASKSVPGKVKTFSVVFDEKEYNEGEYAKLIAKKYDTEHYEVNLSPSDFLKDLPHALSSMDHPSGDGPNSYVVSKAAKDCGVTVALSGLGGDELFAGYDIFKRSYQLLDKKWMFSFPPGIRLLAGSVLKKIKPSISSDKIAEIITQKYLELPYYYHINRKIFSDSIVRKLIMRDSLPMCKPFQFAKDNIDVGSNGFDMPFLSKISYLEMNTYMQNVLLRDIDQMSMAHSLEVRVPFLDHRLVEYVIGVNDQLKFPSSNKKLLIDSMKDWLPEKLINRPKMGFLLPWDQWMKNELRDFNIEQLMYLKETNLLNKKEIDNLWDRYLKNDPRIPWSRIWPLVVLGHWMKQNGVSA
jgi:asparagine synthase (glutamine-hydrolysing)